jgi:hypothetical protein
VNIITADDVATWLGLPTSEIDAAMGTVVGTVNEYVSGLPVVANAATGDPPTVTVPADVKQGAVMLGARLWRRRNSPAGVEAITEAGATYVARYDPEISRLLQIDGFARPAIG